MRGTRLGGEGTGTRTRTVTFVCFIFIYQLVEPNKACQKNKLVSVRKKFLSAFMLPRRRECENICLCLSFPVRLAQTKGKKKKQNVSDFESLLAMQ
jgi:hypothetical protein